MASRSRGGPCSAWPRPPGAIGLLVGFAVPAIGAAAAIGLFLHFGGAVITVLRTRSHKTVAFPVLHLAPVVAAVVLGYAA